MRLSFRAVAWAMFGSTLNYSDGLKCIPRIGRNGRKTDSIEIESPSKCRTSLHKQKDLGWIAKVC